METRKRTVGNSLRGRENNFDFIRFIAAVLVIYSHAFPLTGGDEKSGIVYMLLAYDDSMGSFGVNIFFILSGFLVTMSYMRTQNVRTFLKARALRILPAFEVVVLFSVFILGPIVTALSAGEYFTSAGTYQYLANLLVFPVNFIQSLPGVFVDNPFSLAVNGSLWTIPIEVVFYFVVLFSGLLGWLKKKNIFLIFAAICAAAFIGSELFLGYAGAGRYITLLLKLAIPFAFGMLLYLFRDKVPLRGLYAIIALVGLLLCCRFFENQIVVNLFLSYLILYVGLSQRFRLYKFAKHGDLSYGLYLFAFPVQQAVTHFGGAGVTPAVNFVLSLVITAVLAFFSWHLVEKRFLKLK